MSNNELKKGFQQIMERSQLINPAFMNQDEKGDDDVEMSIDREGNLSRIEQMRELLNMAGDGYSPEQMEAYQQADDAAEEFAQQPTRMALENLEEIMSSLASNEEAQGHIVMARKNAKNPSAILRFLRSMVYFSGQENILSPGENKSLEKIWQLLTRMENYNQFSNEAKQFLIQISQILIQSKNKMNEYNTNLMEKAQSKSQQRFMGMVHAHQQGKLKNPSAAVKKAAKSMSDKDAEDFASTQHKGKPNRVRKKKTEEMSIYERMMKSMGADLNEMEISFFPDSELEDEVFGSDEIDEYESGEDYDYGHKVSKSSSYGTISGYDWKGRSGPDYKRVNNYGDNPMRGINQQISDAEGMDDIPDNIGDSLHPRYKDRYGELMNRGKWDVIAQDIWDNALKSGDMPEYEVKHIASSLPFEDGINVKVAQKLRDELTKLRHEWRRSKGFKQTPDMDVDKAIKLGLDPMGPDDVYGGSPLRRKGPGELMENGLPYRRIQEKEIGKAQKILSESFAKEYNSFLKKK